MNSGGGPQRSAVGMRGPVCAHVPSPRLSSSDFRSTPFRFMASVRPFRALRPAPELAEHVASVPYDVVSVDEARALAAGNEHSFLHVVRPEIDLPEGTDEHADEVYAKGAEALRALAASEAFVRDDAPRLYVYRLVMNGRAQTGIVGLVSAAEYDADVILKHENTRPDKEDDRTRHLLEQRAHAEPVMLTYRGDDAIDAAVAEAMEGEPLYDFRAKDYVEHTVWALPDSEAVVQAFADVDVLYVADGHHRSAAASRAFATPSSSRPLTQRPVSSSCSSSQTPIGWAGSCCHSILTPRPVPRLAAYAPRATTSPPWSAAPKREA